MSEQSAETPEAIELPPQGNEAFAALMDTLVADDAGEAPGTAAGEAGAADEAPAAGGTDTGGAGTAPAGSAAAGDKGAGGADGAAASDGPGADGAADGDPEQPAAAADGGDRPAAWTAPATDLIPKFGELSTAIEEKTQQAYQNAALVEAREEHQQYFAALEKHPRLLVGTQVPRIDGQEGMETLRDTNDAREWQEATKQLLVAEVRDKASRAMEESGDFLATVHQSIELFQNNADLIPGTKDFDVELANKFATMAKPYELRVDGKLQGYSIPVQPIINSLREQVAAARKKAAPPAASTPAGGAPAAPAKPVDPPQAGIRGKAGSGSTSEDFSALFGTIGLPNLQI